MRPRKTAPIKRNPIARDLANPKYRARIVAPKRGPGSYDRNRRPDRRGGDCHGRAPGGNRPIGWRAANA
jgi:stalled ribosome alternative rescue factor ArfA